MEKIKPATEKEEFVLEDKDYLFITAINELTESINKLISKMR